MFRMRVRVVGTDQVLDEPLNSSWSSRAGYYEGTDIESYTIMAKAIVDYFNKGQVWKQENYPEKAHIFRMRELIEVYKESKDA